MWSASGDGLWQLWHWGRDPVCQADGFLRRRGSRYDQWRNFYWFFFKLLKMLRPFLKQLHENLNIFWEKQLVLAVKFLMNECSGVIGKICLISSVSKLQHFNLWWKSLKVTKLRYWSYLLLDTRQSQPAFNLIKATPPAAESLPTAGKSTVSAAQPSGHQGTPASRWWRPRGWNEGQGKLTTHWVRRDKGGFCWGQTTWGRGGELGCHDIWRRE